MITSEVRPEPAQLPPVAEVMSFGPAPVNRRVRRGVLAACLAAAVGVAGFGIWRLAPGPLPDFTAADLGGVYSGMVRADGTNDVSRVTRDQPREPPTPVAPLTCTPLFAQTLSNQFPVAALDGVSTYWLNEGTATIALTTYRYPDVATARREYAAVSAALKDCIATPVTVSRRTTVTVARQPVTSDISAHLSYVVRKVPLDTGRFSTDVMQLSNTVTWQYRYDYASDAAYTPLGAQQLMESLFIQMQSVQEAHRRR